MLFVFEICVCLQPIIVDARGHLLGRLAATVAKTTLQGEFMTLVLIDHLAVKGARPWLDIH